MDITTIYKVMLYIGILLRCSFYHVGEVDGILFQAPEMMEWSQADQTCQNNNGKLFKPNETLFDVSLFSKCDVNDDLWVAATYIKLTTFVSAFKDDSFTRCEMCQIEESCRITCLYKACGDRCNVLCLGLHGRECVFWEMEIGGNCAHLVSAMIPEPHSRILSERPNNWTEAKQWCSEHVSEFSDKIQIALSFFPIGYCDAVCFWTRNVIKVLLTTEIAHGNEPGECGILHNGTISFTNCTRYLHPLCERVTTALETPRYYFSEGNNSCILMNTKIISMTITQRTNRIHATITTSSTYETLSVANDIARWTTIVLNEETTSLLVPVGVTPSKNDLEDSPKKSDTGIVIGAVVGSVVFLMFTVLGIICVRRKLLQRTFRSKHDTNMHNTDIIDPNQSHDVPLETGSGFTVIAQLESNSEESHTSIVGTIFDLRKPASFLDPDGSKFNYETLTRKVNVNSSNPNSNIDYDGYEHLNSVQERRNDNLTGNIYDTVQYE